MSVLDEQILNKEVIAKGDGEYDKSYVLTVNGAKKRSFEKDEDATKQQVKVLSIFYQTTIGC